MSFCFILKNKGFAHRSAAPLGNVAATSKNTGGCDFFPLIGRKLLPEIFQAELPDFSLAEGRLELLRQHALFLQMDIAFHITAAATDGALIGMLGRGIEIDFIQDLSGRLGVHPGFAGDNGKAIIHPPECLGRHKGVPGAVCAVIINSALPGIYRAILSDGMAGAPLNAFAAPIAQMRLDHVRCRKFCIRQNEAIANHGAKIIRQ